MKRFKGIVLTALAVLLVATYIQVPSASAQSSSAALSIAPRKDYVIDPGDKVNDKLMIRNIDTTQDLQLYLRVIDFTYTDDGGTPKLLLDETVDPTTWSLRPYLKVPETVSIGPGKSLSVDISVSIPSKIGAGSYYSAIIYSTTAPEGGNVGLAASGVTLAFVTVPGKVNENLTLKKFGAYDTDAKKFKTFSMQEPKVIGYSLENKGNVVEAPVGTIKLKSMFGQEYSINDVNPKKSLALIGQTRTYEACIKLKSEVVKIDTSTTDASTCVSAGLWPGMYTASLDIFFGQNGNNTQEIVKTTIFWYLPLWFIVALVLILLIIAFYVWRTVVFFRGGNFRLGGGPRLRRSSRSPRRRR
ncbi:MAG: hypothetical protein ACOH18_00365 [Candidatus Saccharimonadaceae bacterium]